jgi:hypothetical protein
MVVTRLKLPLEQIEYQALLKVAGDELRNPTDQARFIIRQELERRGLLTTTEPLALPAKVNEPQGGLHVTN